MKKLINNFLKINIVFVFIDFHLGHFRYYINLSIKE